MSPALAFEDGGDLALKSVCRTVSCDTPYRLAMSLRVSLSDN